jgi:transketolase
MVSRRDRANAIRALTLDAVQGARSGHIGAPLGMADAAEVLWRDVLRHDPAAPHWPDRDRFVLSNGHGSMLLYALLHLTGYDVSLDDLKGFRQLGSATPGHPEVGDTPGVETTTGPLGQGFANAVGMAIAERNLAERYNRPGHTVVDHRTWVFLGDGCLMEGVSHEAASLAGTLGLGRLNAVYDDNGISIDGDVSGWFRDDTPARFRAYGWHVIEAVDGHDPDAIGTALKEAAAETDRPSLICLKTVIGFGAPTMARTGGAHGGPWPDDEAAATRAALGWSHPPFEIPEAIRTSWDCRARGEELRKAWSEAFDAYEKAHPELAAEFRRVEQGELPEGFAARMDAFLAECQEKAPELATRQASKACLDELTTHLPELVGGSADLSGSNGTRHDHASVLDAEHPGGNYLHFGVREFGMTAIGNGMALHGGLVPFTATFLVFMDYARNAVRLAALMGLRHVIVYTHDSVAVGEDGPTHQPIEQAASLRLIPRLDVWRPADLVETAAAWRSALERRDGPTTMLLSRQKLPHERRAPEGLGDVSRGGYVLIEPDRAPDTLVIATGSEVHLAAAVVRRLNGDGAAVRLVSMPCVEVFERQPQAWRDAVLPPALRRRVVVEAGTTSCWYRYAGSDGRVLGIDDFGHSAPAARVLEHVGMTEAALEAAIADLPPV